jgi:hypothetical protein
MSVRTRNRVPLAISLAVCLLLALSLALSGNHSHGDGRFHTDCAACLWTHEAVAVASLSCFFVCQILITIIRPLEIPFRPILIIARKNGRAPPSSLA